MDQVINSSTPLPSNTAPVSTELRRGVLSAPFITLLVISAASPLSVVAGGFPLGILLGNGAGTPALVIAALVLLLMFAAGYTAMATCVTSAGGFYAMVARGLGGAAGGAAAMLALLCYCSLQFGLYGLLGAVASEALHAQFGMAVPWWACALVALVTVARFGYRQIDFSAKVLAGFVVAEYAIVLALDITILLKGGDSGINLQSFAPKTVTSGHPFLGLLFCFAAFIGFEATTIYSEEARNPKRTIPRATYAALLLVGGFYSFSLWCLIIGAGSDKVQPFIAQLSDPTNFLYALSDHYMSPGFTTALRGMFFMSIYAGLIAFHNAAARYMFSMGRERLLPAFLGQTHPVHKSPHIASLIQTALCGVVTVAFAISGAHPVLTVFALLSNLSTLCVLALMIGTAIAVAAYFQRDPHGHSWLRTRLMPSIAASGLLVALLLAADNFHLLSGASEHLSWPLMSLIPLAGLTGWKMAQRLRRLSPARYAQIGQDHNG